MSFVMIHEALNSAFEVHVQARRAGPSRDEASNARAATVSAFPAPVFSEDPRAVNLRSVLSSIASRCSRPACVSRMPSLSPVSHGAEVIESL